MAEIGDLLASTFGAIATGTVISEHGNVTVSAEAAPEHEGRGMATMRLFWGHKHSCNASTGENMLLAGEQYQF